MHPNFKGPTANVTFSLLLFTRPLTSSAAGPVNRGRRRANSDITMWFQHRSTTHDGTPPAAAMPTPFNFPCGKEFQKYQRDKEERERCAPPGFDEYWSSSVGYYSPALCPRGYTVGCYRWHSDQGPAVEASETAVQCVPR